MRNIRSIDQKLWKQCLQDAFLELDPQAFREKLKAANRAIEKRRLELTSTANPDSSELAELRDGLNSAHSDSCRKRVELPRRCDLRMSLGLGRNVAINSERSRGAA